MTQRSRLIGAVIVLLLMGAVLTGCSAPQAQTWPGLTVDGDTIYAISGTPREVYILDAETGDVKSTFIPAGAGDNKGALNDWSPVTVGGGLAYAGFFQDRSDSNGLYAFDPETGQQQWWVDTKSQILPAPTYVDGVVYFGSTDKKVYAVNAESGQPKPGWPFEAESAIWASPLVVDGRVYVASMDHNLYCLDAETGEEIWKTEVGGAMAKQPLLVDGILYAGAFDGRVHAIKADSGELVEGFDFQAENWVWSTPLLVEDQLFVTALDGSLYALEPDTGNVLAPYPYNSGEIDEGKDVIRANPVQVGDHIMVATEKGRVIAVKGGQRSCSWPSGTPDSPVYTTPVVSGDKVYVIQMNGKVHTLDATALETGACAGTELFSPPEDD
ncbi:MAG: PQQ-binding-like beta-propeller repeat protein [Anaerolineae bacterium]|nr:PQQ-binding-like beta-propeller repeat protein [Anaerolineae bacterium]